MLKTKRGSQVWLITQPAHAELSGQLAAHWGNEEFAAPGHFAASADSERVRREVVLAVAEHDNGWWEWEAVIFRRLLFPAVPFTNKRLGSSSSTCSRVVS